MITALALLITLVAQRAPPPGTAWAAPLAPITGVPLRLVAPAIDVDAEVATFRLAPDLTMPVPQRAALVAWYDYSAEAGGDGNVVLAGHRDWQRQKGVFSDLDRLAEGDEIWIEDAAGNWYRYTVVWTVSIAADTAPVAAIAGYTETRSVTLITCSGAFDRASGQYMERRIVRAELAAVVPAK